MDDQFDDIIARASMLHGVSEDLLRGMIATESSFRPRAKSHAGAKGLMQITPITAKHLGLPKDADLFDPETNIMAGAAYIAELLGRFGNEEDALRAYNAGPTRIRRWLNKGGDPKKLPSETAAYPTKVKTNMAATKDIVAERIAASRALMSAGPQEAATTSPEEQAAKEDMAAQPKVSLRLPDGTVVKGVPKSIASSKDKAAKAAWLVQNGHTTLDALYPSPSPKAAADAAVAAEAGKVGSFDRFLVGAGREFELAGRGMVQGMAQLFRNVDDVKRMEDKTDMEKQLFAALDDEGLGMEDVGQVAAWLPLLIGPTGILRQGAVMAAGAGMQATGSDESRLGNAATAGAATIAGGGLGKAGAALLGRIPQLSKTAALGAVDMAITGGLATAAAAAKSLFGAAKTVTGRQAARGMRELDMLGKAGKVTKRKPKDRSWSRSGAVDKNTIDQYAADITLLRSRGDNKTADMLTEELTTLLRQGNDPRAVGGSLLEDIGHQFLDRTNSKLYDLMQEFRKAGNASAEQAAKELLVSRISGGLTGAAYGAADADAEE